MEDVRYKKEKRLIQSIIRAVRLEQTRIVSLQKNKVKTKKNQLL